MKSHDAKSVDYMAPLNKTHLPDQDAVGKLPDRDSMTPLSAYISVTSDPRVAEYFATNGGSTSSVPAQAKL